mmetsp:Transcript_4470/g.8885  ORF Transcript_4470/g.8885 Transcript_4470/m.8885 type:complete len:162 (-) Transcript_4470:800-1285(-)
MNGLKYEEGNEDPKHVITGLCRQFYQLGWVTGTGGGISIRENGKWYIAPSGVQKERIHVDDIFIVDEATEVVEKSPNKRTLKMSACYPLFRLTFHLRDAGACIHTHSIHAVLATLISADTFVVTHLEMIKGIEGHGYRDRLEVPIIENTPHEEELEASMRE